MRDLHVAGLSLVLGAIVALPSAFSPRQERPPIPGVTGTIALEGTVDSTYAGANTVIVKTAGGLRRLFHLTKRTVVHGTTDGDAALNPVNEGSHVVVHYASDRGEDTAEEIDRIGEDGLGELRGIVTRVDRAAGQLTIRLDDGSDQALLMTERAARNSARNISAGAQVIVYYTNEGAQKIAHYVSTVRPD
jgi:hypothetical protein